MMAPLASADSGLDLVRRVAEARHEDWADHVGRCLRCAFGQRCRIASWLATEADSAGLRLQRAEERERARR